MTSKKQLGESSGLVQFYTGRERRFLKAEKVRRKFVIVRKLGGGEKEAARRRKQMGKGP